MKIVNCKLRIKNRRGFSFVEAMVVVAIIGIMSGIVLTSLNKNRTEKEVEGAAREVAASVREAQNNALTGKVGPSGRPPCRFGWRNFVNSGVNPDNNYDYWIRLWIKNAQGECKLPNAADDIKYSLKNGVKFQSTSEPVGVDFEVPFGTMTKDFPVTITVTKGGKCANITVSPSGNVTEGSVTGC